MGDLLGFFDLESGEFFKGAGTDAGVGVGGCDGVAELGDGGGRYYCQDIVEAGDCVFAVWIRMNQDRTITRNSG